MGCQSGAGGSSAPTPTPLGSPPPEGSYEPYRIGNAWTYDRSDFGTSSEDSVVESFGDIGGEKAGIDGWRIRQQYPDGSYQLVWHEDRGVVIVRHREQVFDTAGNMVSETYYLPSKLRIDMQPSRLVASAAYSEEWDEKTTYFVSGGATFTNHLVANWTVEATDEAFTTSAGTFNCIRLRRVITGATPSDREYRFAPQVGKVIETSGSHAETLHSYSLAP